MSTSLFVKKYVFDNILCCRANWKYDGFGYLIIFNTNVEAVNK